MAAKQYIGTKITKIGAGLLLIALVLYIFVIVSIYAVTSYYDKSWQHLLIRLSTWALSTGILMLPLGFVFNAVQGKYDKKR